MVVDQRLHPPILVVLSAGVEDLEEEVGPLESAHVHGGRGQAELAHDVALYEAGRGRRQRDRRRVAQRLAHVGQAQVVRAEVVAPLADAVGLVDGEEPDLDLGEGPAEALVGEALWRNVEQLVSPQAQRRQPVLLLAVRE